MRVLIYLLMIVTATALSLGAGLLVAFQLADASRGLLLATAFAAPFIVMGPVMVGAFAGYWDHRSSPESARYLRWVFAAVVAIDVVASVVVVLATLSAQAPVWVPVVLIGGAALLLVVARPLGAVFRRTEPPIRTEHDDLLPDARALRRKVRAIVVTFVVSAVLATIGAVLLTVFSDDRPEELVRAVLLAGQLTFTATAMAAIVVALPLSRALRDTGGRDIGRLRRYAKVVLRGKDLPLDEDDARGVVRYARIIPLSLQFQLAFVGLLAVALAFQSVSEAVEGSLGVVPGIVLGGVVLVLVWAVPLNVRRIGRARRYAEQHGGAVGGTRVGA